MKKVRDRESKSKFKETEEGQKVFKRLGRYYVQRHKFVKYSD